MLEDHSVGLMVISVVSIIVFFFGLLVNCSRLAFLFSGFELIPTLFEERQANVTVRYQLPVTPGSWAEAVWVVLYVYQALWLAYALTAICRRTPLGPVYNHPKLLPVSVHTFFDMAILQQTAWLILFDRNFLALSLLVIVLSAACSIISLCEALRRLNVEYSDLVQEFRQFDIWAVRIFAHNGLAFLAAWITLNLTLTFVLSILSYLDTKALAADSLSVTQLGIVAFIIIAYTAADIGMLDQWTRYVLTPYLALIIFLAGPLYKDWPSAFNPVFLFLATFQCLSFLLILIKVIVMSCRHILMAEDIAKGKSRSLSPVEESKYFLP